MVMCVIEAAIIWKNPGTRKLNPDTSISRPYPLGHSVQIFDVTFLGLLTVTVRVIFLSHWAFLTRYYWPWNILCLKENDYRWSTKHHGKDFDVMQHYLINLFSLSSVSDTQLLLSELWESTSARNHGAKRQLQIRAKWGWFISVLNCTLVLAMDV